MIQPASSSSHVPELEALVTTSLGTPGYMYICIYVYMYICMYMHVYMHMCIYIYISYLHMYVYIYVYVTNVSADNYGWSLGT